MPELGSPAEQAKTAAPVVPPPMRWWPVPTELMAQLDALSADCEISAWALEVSKLLDELTSLDSPHAARASEILSHLDDLARNPASFLSGPPALGSEIELIRAQNALARRVDIWRRIPDMSTPLAVAADAPASTERIGPYLDAIALETSNDPAGRQWREYLMFDALEQLRQRREAASQDERRFVARLLLGRLERHGLSASQRKFLGSGPLADLRRELHHWTVEPVDARQMVFHLEQFEHSQLPSHARLVAGHYNRLVWCGGAPEQEIARFINAHYRNANVRLSIAPGLVNRLIPPQRPRILRVNDHFLGHPTRGWSTTETKVDVRLLPDPGRLRLALRARGQSHAETDTSSGPVVTRTQTDSDFIAEKELELSPEGIRDEPVQVEAESVPCLRSVRSDLDFLPLVRSLVHDVARTRHEENLLRVRLEARRKIRREVGTQMESELAPRIRTVNARLHDRVVAPLTEMELEPQIIEASTTEDRLTLRLRLAAESQLAGNSPRPREPADSLAGIQIHQSVLNNICEQLHWNGRTLSLPQMREEVMRRLHMELTPAPDSLPPDLAITFAAENALRVECRDGRIGVSLSIARLERSPHSWRDFTVRVFYKPDLSTAGGRLVRDGSVQLIGDRLGPKSQIALRGIFSKAFPQSKAVQVVPDSLLAHPALVGLGLTQFEIRDGWMGLALGPQAHTVVQAPASTSVR